MSRAWSQCTIDSLCLRVTSGGTPSRKHPEYFVGPNVTGGVPWLKTKELDDTAVHNTEEYITKSAIAASSAKVLPRQTVVMAMYGATVGKLGMLATEMTCNQAVCAMVVDPNKTDPKFLFYRLLQDRPALVGLATGSAQQNLSGTVIKNFKVSCPPLIEQRRIAGVLGALDDLIDTNKRLIDQIYELCSDRYSQARANSLGTVRLGDVVDVNPWQTKSQVEGFLTYLDIAALGDGNIDWPTHSAWADAPSRARRLAKPGCTLWSTVRPNRRAHALLTHVPEDLVVSTGLAVLAPKTLGPAELYAATNESDFVDFLMSRADGSAYPAVRASTFEDAPIANLGTDASLQFEAYNWPLLQMAGELSNESNQLSQTRDELLPLLLSGAVSVSEVAA